MKKRLRSGGFVQRLRSVLPRLWPWVWLIVKILDMTSDYDGTELCEGTSHKKLA